MCVCVQERKSVRACVVVTNSLRVDINQFAIVCMHSYPLLTHSPSTESSPTCVLSTISFLLAVITRRAAALTRIHSYKQPLSALFPITLIPAHTLSPTPPFIRVCVALAPPRPSRSSLFILSKPCLSKLQPAVPKV